METLLFYYGSVQDLEHLRPSGQAAKLCGSSRVEENSRPSDSRGTESTMSPIVGSDISSTVVESNTADGVATTTEKTSEKEPRERLSRTIHDAVTPLWRSVLARFCCYGRLYLTTYSCWLVSLSLSFSLSLGFPMHSSCNGSYGVVEMPSWRSL